jgi:aspartyl aminopeptidase
MTGSPVDPADDLLRFIDDSPSPFHAVATMAARLEAAGFRPLDERDRWSLSAGDRRYVVRDGGSLVAFRVGTAAPADAGLRLVGAHTDSPTLKLRPLPDVRRVGWRLAGVEPYGGLLAHTWLDRDLTLAGRVAVRDAAAPDGLRLELLRLPGAPLRIPSLAIHLDRSVREGLQLDPQRHLVPLWGPDTDGAPDLGDLLAATAGCEPDDLLGWDLVAADTQPAARWGRDGELLAAPRLDNQASCYAGTLALLAAAEAALPHTVVLVANDHEEVGSGSAEGARGPFLEDVLGRLHAALGETDGQAVARAAARSRLISADMAHAVHPNYADRHEPGHSPVLGGGPVLKTNANQAYASDAGTGGWFAARCAEAGVPLQHFVTRADLPCGSTIGPLSATRLGIPTVDVGAPMLGMHACRETAAAADVPLYVAALTACLRRG